MVLGRRDNVAPGLAQTTSQVAAIAVTAREYESEATPNRRAEIDPTGS